MAHGSRASSPGSACSSRDDVDLHDHVSGEGLGVLDITTDAVPFEGLEQELDECGDVGMLSEILDGGADPSQFARQYESQLHAAEVQAVGDFTRESANLAALHDEILECDGVLAAVEDVLGRFQADLGTISSEIRSLQEQSEAMGVALRNRKALQRGLAAFVDRLALPPALIHGIVGAEAAGQEFGACLQELAGKLAFAAGDEQVRRSAAFRDIAAELEWLRVTSVGRCRDLLLDRIFDLRRPRTNVQIKQNLLLRHRPAAAFLRAQVPAIYAEVRAAYVDKVSSKIGDVFRSYWAAMERLEVVLITADDVLGAPEPYAAATSVGGVLSLLQRATAAASGPSTPPASPRHGAGAAGAGGSGSRAEVFSLRDRASVLARADAAPLILHVAEAEGRRFPFEALFRSLSKLLVDTAAHEYLFCRDFWGEDGRVVYRSTFAPVLAFVEASLGAALQEQADPLALLMAIRLTRHYSLAMSRRANPALDDHFDRVTLLLWPRLKAVLDAQLASLKAVPPEPADAPPRVLPLTERYAELTASVLLLHSDLADGPLEGNIERMRYAVMNLLLQMSRGVSPCGRGTVFLVLNFSHVVAVLKEAAQRGLPAQPPTPGGTDLGHGEGPPLGAAGEAVLQSFQDSLSRATALYVDNRLSAGVPQLVAFVKKGEAAAARVAEGGPVPGFGPAEAAPVVRDFTSRWERVVGVLNREVAADFGPTPTGRAVQQAAFTQLLLHWSRFLDLCRRQGAEGAAVVGDAVAMPSIMFALKQYRLG